MDTTDTTRLRSDAVLLIEDDTEIANLVAMNLKDLNLRTERANDGLSVCRGIRKKDGLIPILMLTARSGEIDRVVGLEIGADDYITKPFSIRELMARVKALLRRAQAAREAASLFGPSGLDDPASRIDFGSLSLDTTKRKVTLEGQVVDLTAKEFDLLALFVRSPGRAFSRTELLNLVWGYQFEGYEHTVNTHINRLRNKIESDPAHPTYLKTMWGVGYRFAELDEISS